MSVALHYGKVLQNSLSKQEVWRYQGSLFYSTGAKNIVLGLAGLND